MSTTTSDDAAAYIAARITEHLITGDSVLWLVSGGSALIVAKQARDMLAVQAEALHNLTVGLIDERYGLVGHVDSNAEQLRTAGFAMNEITFKDVLVDGLDQAATTAMYNDWLLRTSQQANFVLGLFGMGSDGHTAGILPFAPILQSTGALYDYYVGPDYERLSMTADAIQRCDEAVLYTTGQNKAAAMEAFVQDGPIDAVPARIVKTAKKYTVFSDYNKETT